MLMSIPPERATVRKMHELLLDLFRREMDFRRAEHRDYKEWEFDYNELIYWCGLLLYLVGDPADAPLMWNAKRIDFDIGCCFDLQFLVGAGVDETLKYLEDLGENETADYIKTCRSSGDFADLPRWERFRIHYFYPHITFPENDTAHSQ